MKYLDEFRDPEIAKKALAQIKGMVTRPWVIMEICGGQTHAIIKHGIDQLLPKEIELVHGPGCPVCVTPLEYIDKAIRVAGRSEVIFTTYGDMMRVPGSKLDLFRVKSQGGDMRMVYSPLQALQIARDNPDKKVIFFSVGFETTAPNTAMAVHQASVEKLPNFFALVSHVLVPPAIETLVKSPHNRVQAYLLAGHVCAIMGFGEYAGISEKYSLPMAVTGFEPVDLLAGIAEVVRMLETGQVDVINRYSRVVKKHGNRPARALVARVFQTVDRKWRGIGAIPQSGYKLADEYAAFDAETHFDLETIKVDEPAVCISGVVLQGLKKPFECPAFGKECTPQTPLGATMVSSEGACAAYYNYHRHLNDQQSVKDTMDIT